MTIWNTAFQIVGVVGGGTMGSSIAICLAASGFKVNLLEVNQEALDKGMGNIDRILASLVKRGLLESESQSYKDRIIAGTDFAALSQAGLVIEAVPEQLSIKQKVFAQLDSCCHKDCILASNTSSLSITQLASFTKRPELVIGLHFFNPAHIMQLVEVVPGLRTAHSTLEDALALVRQLNKLAVKVDECASFLVNRLLGRYTNEALWCVQDGSAQVEEIDEAACRLLMPVGPLTLRDLNGMDIGLAVAEFNFREYGERFRPAPLLKEFVNLKMLGKKTGRGFYLYENDHGQIKNVLSQRNTRKKLGVNPEVKEIVARLSYQANYPKVPFDPLRLFLPMINEAFLALQEKICAPEELDLALKAGLNMRKGPLEFAFEIGLPECLKEMENLFDTLGERFRPAPLLKRYVWAGKTSLTS